MKDDRTKNQKKTEDHDTKNKVHADLTVRPLNTHRLCLARLQPKVREIKEQQKYIPVIYNSFMEVGNCGEH